MAKNRNATVIDRPADVAQAAPAPDAIAQAAAIVAAADAPADVAAPAKAARPASIAADGTLIRTIGWPFRVSVDPNPDRDNSYLVVDSATGSQARRITGRGFAIAAAREKSAKALGIDVVAFDAAYDPLAGARRGGPAIGGLDRAGSNGAAKAPRPAAGIHVHALIDGKDIGTFGNRAAAKAAIRAAIAAKVADALAGLDSADMAAIAAANIGISECRADHIAADMAADMAAIAAALGI